MLAPLSLAHFFWRIAAIAPATTAGGNAVEKNEPWRGSGFNAIWQPDNNQPPENSAIHRFLELNPSPEAQDLT
jgi:hypothetical protein